MEIKINITKDDLYNEAKYNRDVIPIIDAMDDKDIAEFQKKVEYIMFKWKKTPEWALTYCFDHDLYDDDFCKRKGIKDPYGINEEDYTHYTVFYTSNKGKRLFNSFKMNGKLNLADREKLKESLRGVFPCYYDMNNGDWEIYEGKLSEAEMREKLRLPPK